MAKGIFINSSSNNAHNDNNVINNNNDSGVSVLHSQPSPSLLQPRSPSTTISTITTHPATVKDTTLGPTSSLFSQASTKFANHVTSSGLPVPVDEERAKEARSQRGISSSSSSPPSLALSDTAHLAPIASQSRPLDLATANQRTATITTTTTVPPNSRFFRSSSLPHYGHLATSPVAAAAGATPAVIPAVAPSIEHGLSSSHTTHGDPKWAPVTARPTNVFVTGLLPLFPAAGQGGGRQGGGGVSAGEEEVSIGVTDAAGSKQIPLYSVVPVSTKASSVSDVLFAGGESQVSTGGSGVGVGGGFSVDSAAGPDRGGGVGGDSTGWPDRGGGVGGDSAGWPDRDVPSSPSLYVATDGGQASPSLTGLLHVFATVDGVEYSGGNSVFKVGPPTLSVTTPSSPPSLPPVPRSLPNTDSTSTTVHLSTAPGLATASLQPNVSSVISAPGAVSEGQAAVAGKSVNGVAPSSPHTTRSPTSATSIVTGSSRVPTREAAVTTPSPCCLPGDDDTALNPTPVLRTDVSSVLVDMVESPVADPSRGVNSTQQQGEVNGVSTSSSLASLRPSPVVRDPSPTVSVSHDLSAASPEGDNSTSLLTSSDSPILDSAASIPDSGVTGEGQVVASEIGVTGGGSESVFNAPSTPQLPFATDGTADSVSNSTSVTTSSGHGGQASNGTSDKGWISSVGAVPSSESLSTVQPNLSTGRVVCNKTMSSSSSFPPNNCSDITGNVGSDSSGVSSVVIGLSVCLVLLVLAIVTMSLLCVRRKRKRKKKGQKNSQGDLWMEPISRHVPAISLSGPAPEDSLTSLRHANSLPVSVDTHTAWEGEGGEQLYMATQEFVSQQKSQLSLNPGDVISVQQKLDNGWWKGNIKGDNRSGWFPCNFVMPVQHDAMEQSQTPEGQGTDGEVPEPQTPKPRVSSFLVRKKHGDNSLRENNSFSLGRIANIQNSNGVTRSASALIPLPGVRLTPSPSLCTEDFASSVKDKYYKALFAYKAAFRGELSLQEGEIIEGRERDQNGWMLGRKVVGGEEGWFPAVYVDQINGDLSALSSASKRDVSGEASLLDHEVYGLLSVNRNKSPDQSWVGIEHQVLKAYKGQDGSQISLKQGQLVTVVEALESGWWLGYHGDQVGWFPGDHVELLEEKLDQTLDSIPLLNLPTSSHLHLNNHLDLSPTFKRSSLDPRDLLGKDMSHTHSKESVLSEGDKPKPARKAPAPPVPGSRLHHNSTAGSGTLSRNPRPMRPAPAPPALKGRACSVGSVDRRAGLPGHSPLTNLKDGTPKRQRKPRVVRIPKERLGLDKISSCPSPACRPGDQLVPRLSAVNSEPATETDSSIDGSSKAGSTENSSSATETGSVNLTELPGDSQVQTDSLVPENFGENVMCDTVSISSRKSDTDVSSITDKKESSLLTGQSAPVTEVNSTKCEEKLQVSDDNFPPSQSVEYRTDNESQSLSDGESAGTAIDTSASGSSPPVVSEGLSKEEDNHVLSSASHPSSTAYLPSSPTLTLTVPIFNSLESDSNLSHTGSSIRSNKDAQATEEEAVTTELPLSAEDTGSIGVSKEDREVSIHLTTPRLDGYPSPLSVDVRTPSPNYLTPPSTLFEDDGESSAGSPSGQSSPASSETSSRSSTSSKPAGYWRFHSSSQGPSPKQKPVRLTRVSPPVVPRTRQQKKEGEEGVVEVPPPGTSGRVHQIVHQINRLTSVDEQDIPQSRPSPPRQLPYTAMDSESHNQTTSLNSQTEDNGRSPLSPLPTMEEDPAETAPVKLSNGGPLSDLTKIVLDVMDRENGVQPLGVSVGSDSSSETRSDSQCREGTPDSDTDGRIQQRRSRKKSRAPPPPQTTPPAPPDSSTLPEKPTPSPPPLTSSSTPPETSRTPSPQHVASPPSPEKSTPSPPPLTPSSPPPPVPTTTPPPSPPPSPPDSPMPPPPTAAWTTPSPATVHTLPSALTTLPTLLASEEATEC